MDILPRFGGCGLFAQSWGVYSFTFFFSLNKSVCLLQTKWERSLWKLSPRILPLFPLFPDAGWENERKILPNLGPFGGSSAIGLYKLESALEEGVCLIFNFKTFTPSEQTGGRSIAQERDFKQTTLPAGPLCKGGDLLFIPLPEEC